MPDTLTSEEKLARATHGLPDRKPSITAYTLKSKLMGGVEITDSTGALLFFMDPLHGKLTERRYQILDAQGEEQLQIHQKHTIFFLHYELTRAGEMIGSIRTKGVIDHYLYNLNGMPEHDIKTGMGFTTQYVLKSEGSMVSLIKVGLDNWTVRLGNIPNTDLLLFCLALTFKNSKV